jgi:hypothetical protein
MKKLNYVLAVLFAASLFVGCKSSEDDSTPDVTEASLVSKNVEKRKAVIEEYTGVRCTYCPDGHRRAQSFADANPGKVVIVNVHTGSYASPAAGWMDFTTDFGAALATKAGMGQPGTGYPGGSVNRYPFNEATMTSYKMAAGLNYTLMNRGAWWNSSNSTSPAGDIIFAKDAPVNIGMKVKSFNAAARTAVITVEMYFTSDVPNGAKLNLVLLENNVKGKQIDAGVYNDNYMHKHMLRAMLTGQWGEAIDASMTLKGKTFKKDYTYTLPDNDKNLTVINPDNCEFAAYVTGSTDVDVLNGAMVKLK